MITNLLGLRASDAPAKAFIVTPKGDYSFSRINMAARLAAAGVGKGDHVALVAGNCAVFIVAWFAI